MGITFKANLNIHEYLQALSYIKISDKALEDACRRLKTFSIRREIYETAGKIRSVMTSSGDVGADEIITMADKLYNERISAYDLNEKPEDLFDGLLEIINERADNPVNEVGLSTPFPKFNELYGGLRAGEIYSFVSRAGVGKSTLLNEIAFKTSMMNEGCKALILDTEMTTADIRWRVASAISGVPMWFLETGNWKKNKELSQRLHDSKDKIKAAIGKIQHMNVSMKNIGDITSLIQRWYFGEIGRGNPAIVVYDYIKLTGESDNNKKEYELIGEKVNLLKECALRTNVPVLTACQLNRSAEQGTDDSSAIAQSDRLLWFSSFVGIFRRKTLEEQADDGEKFGSHKLIELKSRFQGKNAQGHSNSIRTVDQKGKVKYQSNFINYNVDNFSVTELGTLEDIVKNKDVVLNVFDDKKGDGLL